MTRQPCQPVRLFACVSVWGIRAFTGNHSYFGPESQRPQRTFARTPAAQPVAMIDVCPRGRIPESWAPGRCAPCGFFHVQLRGATKPERGARWRLSRQNPGRCPFRRVTHCHHSTLPRLTGLQSCSPEMLRAGAGGRGGEEQQDLLEQGSEGLTAVLPGGWPGSEGIFSVACFPSALLVSGDALLGSVDLRCLVRVRMRSVAATQPVPAGAPCCPAQVETRCSNSGTLTLRAC